MTVALCQFSREIIIVDSELAGLHNFFSYRIY